MKYVFPCTGRSGSTYIQALMTACGVKCGHEDVYRIRNIVKSNEEEESAWAFTRDPDEWAHRFEAESSFVLAPYLNDPPCRKAHVVHIVRHPLHVIDSWRHQQGLGSFIFMSKFCDFKAIDYVTFCAGMWVAWNKYIEAQNWGCHPSWNRCRVEDPEDIMAVCGVELIQSPVEEVSLPPTNVNSVGSKRITSLSDIRDEHIRDALVILGKEYGYELQQAT